MPSPCSVGPMVNNQYDTGFDWDPEKMDFAGSAPLGLSIKREHYRNGWDVVV